MSNYGNRQTMSKNLNHYMKENGKSRKQICKDLGFSYSTFCDWVNGNKYPRIDKIEMLANYFGIEKSDLIEEKSIERLETEFATEFDSRFDIERKKIWLDATQGQSLNDDEFFKLIEYLKFIVSQRKKD